MDQNRYVAPDGAVYVAVDEVDDCDGCAFQPGSHDCMAAPVCLPPGRADCRPVIWVRAIEQPSDIATREALLAHIVELPDERDELRTSLAEAMQQCRDTQDRLTAQRAETASMRHERDELRAANATLHDQVNDWHRKAVETRAERDELAARLAQIERAEPACWTLVETLAAGETTCNGRLWFVDPKSCAWVPLYTRPAPAAAPAQEAPTDGCGACGDACQSRASCRLAEESPTPAAKTCRCGPDGCSDSVACPRNGGAA